MIDLCTDVELCCAWCSTKFVAKKRSNNNYPQFCTHAHYLKSYRSGRRDARVNFVIPSDPAKLAYLAGLIDSDGHITVTRNTPTNRAKAQSLMHYPIVGVTNTSEVMLEWIVDNFGGTYSNRMGEKQRVVHVEKNWKDKYEWRMTGKKALALLEEVKEYMVVKKDRAELVLEFRNHDREIETLNLRNGDRLPESIIQDRERIRDAVMALNKRGRS